MDAEGRPTQAEAEAEEAEEAEEAGALDILVFFWRLIVVFEFFVVFKFIVLLIHGRRHAARGREDTKTGRETHKQARTLFQRLVLGRI